MTAVGGSIEEISFAGRIFAVAADADAAMKIGGTENEVQPNGNGTGRIVKTRVVGTVPGLALSIDNDNGDLQFLQERADAKGLEVLSVTYADGSVYQGMVAITGELAYSSANATATVNFSVPGALTKQQ